MLEHPINVSKVIKADSFKTGGPKTDVGETVQTEVFPIAVLKGGVIKRTSFQVTTLNPLSPSEGREGRVF